MKTSDGSSSDPGYLCSTMSASAQGSRTAFIERERKKKRARPPTSEEQARREYAQRQQQRDLDSAVYDLLNASDALRRMRDRRMP